MPGQPCCSGFFFAYVNKDVATRTGSQARTVIYIALIETPEKWCPRADLNHRHADFQSAALPLSYSGYTAKTAWERSL